MKRCLVLGASGQIGQHLVNRLVADGHHVIGVDRKQPEFAPSGATEFLTMDLRMVSSIDPIFTNVDECYQLAAEVGGLGYIMDQANDAAMLRNSMQINLSVLEACRVQKVPRVFFSSSACVYPDLDIDSDSQHDVISSYAVHNRSACREQDAYPAHPDNEYAWEKLFAERLYDAYARNFGLQVRIGRFHNSFGALGTYKGGREKAPAAITRKVVEAEPGTSIKIWGDGSATRSFTPVGDTVEGTIRLMASDYSKPVNIGSSRLISIRDLAQMIATIGGKMLTIESEPGPVGVAGRNSDNSLIKEVLGWEPVYPLELALVFLYRWIHDQVEKDKGGPG